LGNEKLQSELQEYLKLLIKKVHPSLKSMDSLIQSLVDLRDDNEKKFANTKDYGAFDYDELYYTGELLSEMVNIGIDTRLDMTMRNPKFAAEEEYDSSDCEA